MKERFLKAYRHPELEKSLSTERLRAEVRALAKARRQAPLLDQEDEELAAALAQGKASVAARCQPACYTPAVFHVDEEQRRIYMERIEGDTVKQRMTQLNLHEEQDSAVAMKLAAKIGKGVAALHAAGLVHGDLTTSNLLLVPKPGSAVGSLAVIDFGLATVSQLNEDRAVDLYVLERAFLSTHPASESVFAAVLAAYQAAFPLASKVLSKLNVVRSRGRKRQMVG
jgi:TP53 regulating kinase-like protein